VDAGCASRDCNRARDRSCFETILELIDRHLLAAIDAGAALGITAGTTPPRLNLSLHPLLMGELDPREAITSGRVRIEGDHNLLERFAEAFHVPPVPVAQPPEERSQMCSDCSEPSDG
jgi:hypothetical protein